MRKTSTSRLSSANPVRMSVDDTKRAQMLKRRSKSQEEISLIPRRTIRSVSSDRYSVRRSNLKVPAKFTPQIQPRRATTSTAAAAYALQAEPPSASRYLTPSPRSVEKASGYRGKGPQKDNRPITDKAFQSDMLARINQYFASIQCSGLLNSNGSLKPVTIKMFIEATNCLLSIFGIKHNNTMNNYTEELPKVGKKIRYPGNLSKSWLKTANAMHSWPQVLAWLSWLVDTCIAKDLACNTLELENLSFLPLYGDEKQSMSTIISVTKQYNAWNAGRQDEDAALMDELLRSFDESGDIDNDLAKAQENLNKAKENYRALCENTEREDNNSRLQGILASLKEERLNDLESMELKENRIRNIANEIKESRNECELYKGKIQMAEERRAQLNQRLDNQTMSVEEYKELVKECSELQSYIQIFHEHVKSISDEIYAMDIKLAKGNKKLCTSILAYNKDIILHRGCDDGVDLNEFMLPEKDMLSDDFMEILETKKVAISNFHVEIKKQLAEAGSSLEFNKTEVKTLKKKLETTRHDYKKIMTERKNAVSQLQDETDKAEINLKKQINEAEEKLVELQKLMPDIESAEKELAEHRDKFDAVDRRRQFLETTAEQFFEKFYSMRRDHKTELINILNESKKS